MNRIFGRLTFSSAAVMLLLAASLLSSCSTKRSIIRQPLREQGEAYLIQKMDSGQARFDYLSARCAIRIINNKSKTDLRGQLRVKMDSTIWVSLSPALGIEIARLKITNDSIQFINRVDKNYFDGNYQFIARYLTTSIDFDMVQSLILGNDFSSYESNTFRALIDGMEYRLSTTGRAKMKKYLRKEETPNILVQSIWLSPENFKISRVNLKEFGEENKRLQVDYANFVRVNEQVLPGKIVFDIQAEQHFRIEIELSNIELGVAQGFPFKIPDRYDRIE
ncbi:MAG: DUF4292 domain-containing protein [Bacteroidales bacterium]|nr:DUF4292 domain-containing protein [Bacteroidales bacterium]